MGYKRFSLLKMRPTHDIRYQELAREPEKSHLTAHLRDGSAQLKLVR